jgi:hypothetical protein
LRTGSGALSAGPFRIEWEKRAAKIEAELGIPTSISEGKIGGAAGRLDEIAQVSPTSAVVEAFAQVENALRSLLEKHGIKDLDSPWSVRRLAEVALEQGLITRETRDAIEGLGVMRNLAAHGGQKDLSPQRAHEFVALAQGVLYAITMNSKSSED